VCVCVCVCVSRCESMCVYVWLSVREASRQSVCDARVLAEDISDALATH
jgi:hypothetical protein